MARQRPTRLVMGPCIVEIDCIVIRDVQYKFEVIQCRNEEVNFQGSIARTDRQTVEITTISPRFSTSFAYLRGTNILVNSHVIELTGTIFELNSPNFHENWAKNVTSPVFTCFHYIHIEKNAPPTGVHVFSPIPTIFKLVRYINKTNVLTNFHDDWAKIVTSRVFTRENCHYIHIEKNAPPTGGYVFSPISTIFELIRDIN
ncbi:hypothetical protein DPMN_082268 [Dreissena polymorpha]|uniref:Uncharacterized protein n=1 Tax=Dreissena polymorpha TaxID=45954 RepID=A0A9D3Y7U3_DREPO|nr:hypothetical protein DPMN_082268 [Dreissena polymorpha]